MSVSGFGNVKKIGAKGCGGGGARTGILVPSSSWWEKKDKVSNRDIAKQNITNMASLLASFK